MNISVMTYNVAHFSDNRLPGDVVDYEGFARVIADCNADIVGLNEVYAVFYGENRENQLDEIARHSGYSHKYFAKATEIDGGCDYGNALLSKHGFTGATRIVPDPDERELNGKYAETRCVLRADFQLGDRKLTLLDCHFGLNIAEQENAVKTICDMVDEISNPIILMGDFNVTPESHILNPIKERFKDTAELLCGEGNHFTFPANKPCKKIDYIFYRGSIAATSAQVVPDFISDHLAVCASFEI